MKMLKTFAAVLILTISVISQARADVLYGVNNNPYDGPFGFEAVLNGESKWNVVHEGLEVGNKDDGTIFRLMCSDRTTDSSPEYYDSSIGQVYNTVFLSDSTFHSAEQKQQLQSLYDHVYYKAFDQNYDVIDPTYAAIFQLAIWEIMNDTSDTLSLRNGDFYIKDDSFYNTNYDRTAWGSKMTAGESEILLALADAWFNAILNDGWDLIGYSEDKVNLTVWIAEGGIDASQTFIGVAPTPEPASMLIFGIGAAGAFVMRRKIKNKKSQ